MWKIRFMKIAATSASGQLGPEKAARKPHQKPIRMIPEIKAQ